jgi:plastocyanin
MLMPWTCPRVFVSFAGFVGFSAAVAVAILLLFAHPRPTGASIAISQRNRQFSPGALIVRVGDVVTIVNDDGDLHHHAYVSSPDFQFDSGDQAPNSRTDIVFTTPGHFNVLCGIHPKMRLVVTVR